MVVHAGGVLADGLLQRQHLAGVRQVAGCQAAGCWHAFRLLSQQQPVSSLVLFSSVASLLGSPVPGQLRCCQCRAGTVLCSSAGQLGGVPAVSVQWGAWAGGGMAAADVQTAARVERMGMSLIPAQQQVWQHCKLAMCTVSAAQAVSAADPVYCSCTLSYGRGL